MQSKPKSHISQESEVTANKYALSVANFAKTAQSWLGKANNVEKDDNPEFEPDPFVSSDLTGVGYIPPSESIATENRNGLSSLNTTEKLRQQMLGKRARSGRASSYPVQVRGLTASKGRPERKIGDDVEEEEEDEEKGRSRLAGISGKKRGGVVDKADVEGLQRTNLDDGIEINSVPVPVGKAVPSTVPKKRGGTFLDEILAERANKKKRKKKKKEK